MSMPALPGGAAFWHNPTPPVSLSTSTGLAPCGFFWGGFAAQMHGLYSGPFSYHASKVRMDRD